MWPTTAPAKSTSRLVAPQLAGENEQRDAQQGERIDARRHLVREHDEGLRVVGVLRQRDADETGQPDGPRNLHPQQDEDDQQDDERQQDHRARSIRSNARIW
jgi:hypothetical protein